MTDPREKTPIEKLMGEQLEEIKKEEYERGYSAGYDAGYENGYSDSRNEYHT